MNRSLILTLLLAVAMDARENPFFATDPSQTQKVTSNLPDNRPPLGTVTYSFPDQSRIIKEITFTVQNLDGSIETQKIQVDRMIDWHKPVLISQGKSSVSEISGIKGSTADFGPVKIETRGKRLTLSSSASIVRHFTLTGPNRIVIDLNDDRSLNKIEKTLNAPPYMSASVGNHGKFIRTTITLDGRYGYTLKKSGNTVSIVCK